MFIGVRLRLEYKGHAVFFLIKKKNKKTRILETVQKKTQGSKSTYLVREFVPVCEYVGDCMERVRELERVFTVDRESDCMFTAGRELNGTFIAGRVRELDRTSVRELDRSLGRVRESDRSVDRLGEFPNEPNGVGARSLGFNPPTVGCNLNIVPSK